MTRSRRRLLLWLSAGLFVLIGLSAGAVSAGAATGAGGGSPATSAGTAAKALAGGRPVGWSTGAGGTGAFAAGGAVSSAYFAPQDEVVLFGGSPRDAGKPWRHHTWVYANPVWS